MSVIGPKALPSRQCASQTFLLTVLLASTGCIIPTRGQVVDERQPEWLEPPQRDTEDTEPEENGERAAWFPAREPPSRSEGAYCRAMRPVIRELRGTAGRHIRCIASDYSTVGYFGDRGDLASHSYVNACFAGSSEHAQTVRLQQQPLPQIRTTVTDRRRIGTDATLDLRRYGIEPGRFVFDGLTQSTTATIELTFTDPTIRTATSLGYTLAATEANQRAPERVRSAAAECRSWLCQPHSMHTDELISATPQVVITLEDATAEGLRARTIGDPTEVLGSGERFWVMPRHRVNIAAKFADSRDAMLQSGACGRSAQEVEASSPGATPPCTTFIQHGLHIRLDACRRISPKTVCEVAISSPMRDRDLTIFIRDGEGRTSSVVDGRGAQRPADLGNVGATFEQRYLSLSLVADSETKFLLEFPGVGTKTSELRRLTIAARTDHDLSFDFRDIDLLEQDAPSCGGR